MPQLTELAQVYPALNFDPKKGDPFIEHITADSRQVKKLGIFVVIKGNDLDGEAFIDDAIANGAVAVIHEGVLSSPLPIHVTDITVENARHALAKLAAHLYAPQPDYVTAVTGTDGKTSTAEFFRQIVAQFGVSAASIGTLGLNGIDVAGGFTATNTSPDPVQLHKTLQTLTQKGCHYVCIETSSHGLDQYRSDGVNFKAAAFTNLTRDHLDYHKTIEAYKKAKLRLFEELLPEGATVVVNADDPLSETIHNIAADRNLRYMSYGIKGEELKLESIAPHPGGMHVDATLFGERSSWELPLIGAFQAMNVLAALGLYIACGGALPIVVENLSKLKGVRGRLEHVATLDNGATLYVDFAHTPGALERLLQTVRPHVENTLHLVFGCGGDRDKGKRPVMGEIAGRLADEIIVTDDNPRTEDSATIRKEIIAAVPHAKEIGDRKQAIAYAIGNLKSGDVLIIAGKGHETYQIVGEERLDFDDVMVSKKLVEVA